MLTRLILTIAAAIFCLHSIFSEASPQRCEESTFQYIGIYMQNFSISISADIKLINATSVTVTNINADVENLTISDMDVTLNQLCVYGRAGAIMTCNDNFTDTITATIGDSNVIELQMYVATKNIYFESDVYVPFYSGIIDGSGISFFDGRLYDENTKCLNYAYQDGKTLNFNVSECCNFMKPIIVPTTNDQTCSHFTSASTISNTVDKSVYASISIDYGIVNNNVTMFGKFNGSADYQPYLLIDDAQGCAEILNGTIYCGYPLSDGGNKLLVFMSEYFNYTQIYGFANRIILRNGLALMDDATPFTVNNTCTTFTYPYDSSRNLQISTKSCCSAFQSYIDPTASPSPSTTPDASPSPSTTPDASPSPSTTPDASASPSSLSSSIGTTTTSGSNSFSFINPISMFLAVIVSFMVFKV